VENAPRDDNWEDRLDLRMAAWSRLFSNYPYPSPVFVTHGQAVLRRLAGDVPGRLRFSFSDLSHAFQRLACENRPPAGDIMSQLAALAAAPLSLPGLSKDDAEGQPTEDRAEEPCVHLWLEIPPRCFFGRTLATGPTESKLPPLQSTWRNTLVVQMP
jgi:hypothetical protein